MKHCHQPEVGSASPTSRRDGGRGKAETAKSGGLGPARGTERTHKKQVKQREEKETKQGSQAGKSAKRRARTEPEWEGDRGVGGEAGREQREEQAGEERAQPEVEMALQEPGQRRRSGGLDCGPQKE